jgi:hypothetical protein
MELDKLKSRVQGLKRTKRRIGAITIPDPPQTGLLNIASLWTYPMPGVKSAAM